MDTVQATKMSQALKSISDVNRIRILQILSTGEYCVTDLVERLQIDQPKVSHHLAILRVAGVIRSRRDGRHINYSLKPSVHHSKGQQNEVFDLGCLSVSFRFDGVESAFESGGAGVSQTNGASLPSRAQPPLRTGDAHSGA